MRNYFYLPILCLSLLLFGAACSSSADTREGGEGANEKEQPASGTNSGEAGEKSGDGSGCVLGDCENGTGTYVWPGGSKYAGQFKDGLRNGTGTYSWPSGSQYVGEYLNGLRHGKGAYTWSDGHNYVGEFKEDMKHGKGVYTWADGTVFEGVWENDQRGEGTFSKIPES
ncbi:MAG: phosphatidylinositol kinase [bacterium]|nr:phosphatidylinositol kinase [bacterium]